MLAGSSEVFSSATATESERTREGRRLAVLTGSKSADDRGVMVYGHLAADRRRAMLIGRARQWVVAATSVALLATAVVAGGSPAHAASDEPTMSGWLPYWSLGSATSAAVANADLFSDVSPFWFDATADGSKASTVSIDETWINSGSRSSVTASLRDAGIDVLPSITDSTGTRYLAGVLSSSVKRSALVTQIANLVESGNYDGIDLDFETFAFSDGQGSWATTKPAWITFIGELSARLHTNGKLLAVSVPPMYSDSSGYWVYAFRDIAEHIDRLRIMAYDYSWSTAGSVGGPLSWVRGLLTYAVDAVGRKKVYLGTPTYGRDWVTGALGTGCPTTSNQRAALTRTMNTSSVTFTSAWERDSASQERHRTYTEPYNSGQCTLTRSAWIPDAHTTVARWQVAKEFRIAGLAQWMVGTEQVGQWDLLRAEIPSEEPSEEPFEDPPPTVPETPILDHTEPAAGRPIELRVGKVRKKKIVLRGSVAQSGRLDVRIVRKTKSGRKKMVTVRSDRSGDFRGVVTSKRKRLKLKAKSSIGSSAWMIVRR